MAAGGSGLRVHGKSGQDGGAEQQRFHGELLVVADIDGRPRRQGARMMEKEPLFDTRNRRYRIANVILDSNESDS